MSQPRRRGRPALPDDIRTEPASVRLPLPVYDEVCRVASRNGVSVSRVLRYAVTLWLKREQAEVRL